MKYRLVINSSFVSFLMTSGGTSKSVQDVKAGTTYTTEFSVKSMRYNLAVYSIKIRLCL